MTTESAKKRILVIHGPNLNMLGRREPEVYGSKTLAEIDDDLKRRGEELGLAVETFQSNHEGAIVDRIQEAVGNCEGIIINPAAYTHTSVAIRDALLLHDVPIIEVHLSNIHQREGFRHHSTIADVATGRIAGFGDRGYQLSLEGFSSLLL
ncbi:MAG: type II 3-dehydroquinate dehydratase [Desulfococcaceae bacterium]